MLMSLILALTAPQHKLSTLLIRQVLEPSELPKLIIWADGSRAFNSGREDVTFKAIAASKAYKQALQKTQAIASSEDSPKIRQIHTESK